LRPSKFFKKASGGDINTGMKKLSPKQKEIAAKAPPPDKIDSKDFAVLKAEKAKGRGMGLQDEKVKPGKVMKAREGKMFKGYSKVFETGAEHGAKGKQPSTIVGVKPNVGKKVASKIPGRIGKTLGVVSMLVPAAYAAAKQYKDYKSAKNRDKAKVKKYSDGMSYKDMAPYGGKYAKKKNEMIATASENVKRLTTQPDAYDPEERYLVGEKRKRNSTIRTVRKTTDQVNLREAANKLKEQAGPGFNVSINTKSDLINKRLIRPKRMAGRMGGGMMKKYSKGMSKEDITQEGKRGIAAGKAVGESLRDKNAPMKRQRLADRQPVKKKNILDKFTDKLNKAGEAYKKLGGAGLNVLRGNTKGQPFPAKKMGGGMAKKYSVGGGADTGTAGETKSRRAVASDRLKRRLNTAIERRRRLGRELGPIGGFGGIPSPKRTPGAGPKGLIPERLSRQDIVFTTDKSFLKDMKPPSGAAPGKFKSGTMVKARGCKLGRTRPTKIT